MLATFLLGCQRSGTTALLEAFSLSPHVRAFGEGDPNVMLGYRLLPPEAVLNALRVTTQHPVLKPISESHHADRVLHVLPEARAVWIHRDVRAVAASMLAKWPGHMAEVAARLRARDLPWLDWRAERLDDRQWVAVDALLAVATTEPDAAAVFWYLRNQWVLALGLDAHPRVRLLAYEELAHRPQQVLAEVFAFAGVPFHPACAAAYHSDSVGRGAALPLHPVIDAACAELRQRLNAATPPVH